MNISKIDLRFKKKIFWLLLSLTLILGVFLRLYKITEIPSGTYFDEVVVGDNSFFLSKLLEDEFGNKFPDFIKIADDYRHGVIFYATTPFVKTLGLNILAVRLPTAAFGIFILIASFFLTLLLTRNRKIALIALLMLSVSPWLTNLSRSSNEVIFALFFLLLASISYLLAIEDKKIFLIFIYLFLLLAWFSYTGAILLSFLHAAFFVFFSFFSKTSKQIKVLTAIVFIIFIIFPNLYYYTKNPEKITGRFNSVSVFAFKEPQLILEEQIREDGISQIPAHLSRFFHNKIINYSSTLIKNYSLYFSPQFLFGMQGGPPRYKIPDFGNFYYLDIPLFIAGIYFLLKRLTRSNIFVIFWLLAGAVPAALTVEDIPNMQRSIFMIPAWHIIIAYGIYYLIRELQSFKYNRSALLLITGVTIFYFYFFSLFLHNLFIHQPIHQNWHRHSEWMEAARIVQNSGNNYGQLNIYGTIAHYFLFFYSSDYREEFLSNPKRREEYLENRNLGSDWKLGKYLFRHEACFEKESIKEIKPNTLYSVGQNCPIPEWVRIVGKASTSDGVVMMTFFDAPYDNLTINKFIEDTKLKF